MMPLAKGKGCSADTSLLSPDFGEQAQERASPALGKVAAFVGGSSIVLRCRISCRQKP
jgi:hypothetical protein